MKLRRLLYEIQRLKAQTMLEVSNRCRSIFENYEFVSHGHDCAKSFFFLLSDICILLQKEKNYLKMKNRNLRCFG